MDFYVILLTGSICFVLMAILKLIMRKMIASGGSGVSDKALATFAYVVVFIFCIIVYAVILRYLGNFHIASLHFKLCYVIKAWTVSVALNSVFEHII